MSYDPRLTPARPDLAAAHLHGRVEAARYVEGRAMHVGAELADLRRAPTPDAAIDTQALHGENVTLYDDDEGWGWVQLAGDGYVGYVSINALAPGARTSTHRLAVNRSFVYPQPNIKLPPLAALPLGAEVTVLAHENNFSRLADGGFVIDRHLTRIDEHEVDFVAVAGRLVNVPYLWGGKSSLGIDCSGLVQLALWQAGIVAPRDTDMQVSCLGTRLTVGNDLAGLRRGDLVFWSGHVGIMRDAQELIHANAHHMLVATEPLAQARDRIAAQGGGAVVAIKRL